MEKVDFISRAALGEKEYRDFNSVSFRRKLFIMPVLLVLDLVYTFCYRDWLALYFSAAAFAVVGLSYILRRVNISRGFKRLKLSLGKEEITYVTRFGETIETGSGERSVEYDYSLVRKLYETKFFYLLGFQYHLYVIVSKNDFEKEELLTYLSGKCPSLRKKKFVNISFSETVMLIFLALFAALAAINLIF